MRRQKEGWIDREASKQIRRQTHKQTGSCCWRLFTLFARGRDDKLNSFQVFLDVVASLELYS
jgi:hypothetical protein